MVECRGRCETYTCLLYTIHDVDRITASFVYQAPWPRQAGTAHRSHGKITAIDFDTAIYYENNMNAYQLLLARIEEEEIKRWQELDSAIEESECCEELMNELENYKAARQMLLEARQIELNSQTTGNPLANQEKGER